MPGESNGAQGSMRLYRHWSESPSGHKETEEIGTLSTGGTGEVLFTVNVKTDAFYPGKGGDSYSRVYSIDPRTLAELVVKHGKKIR